MSLKQIRILNVDDNQIQRYATTRMLMSAGFAVVEAGTGKEALSLANSNVDSATANIPIIQVSAVFSTYSHVRDGLRNGADAYFTFPLDAKSLISTVRQLTTDLPA